MAANLIQIVTDGLRAEQQTLPIPVAGGWIVSFGSASANLVACIIYGTVGGLVLAIYFSKWIQPNQGKWARSGQTAPPALQGRWQTDLGGAFNDIKLCCFGAWFPHCLNAEVMYRSGWSHAAVGDCNGNNFMVFHGGFWPVFIAQGIGCGCCVAGVLAGLRGGDTCQVVKDATPMDRRFGLQVDFLWAFLTAVFCPWCMACQHYTQIMSMVEHPEFVVGAPTVVQMQAPLQGQPLMPVQGQEMQGQPLMPAQGQVPQGQVTQGQVTQGQMMQGQAVHGQAMQGQAMQGQAMQN